MKRLSLAALLAALCLFCSACGEKAEQSAFFAMDTSMVLTVYGKDAQTVLSASQQEIQRLETLFSRTREDSLVSALNRGERVSDPELCALLRQALEESRETGGCFDITVAPVVAAWGFTTEQRQVPPAEEIQALLPFVGSGGVLLEGDTAWLGAGVSVDLGGIAKGYASDRIAALWQKQGVRSGIAQLGGNVYACGAKPDGSGWKVGVRDPAREDGYLGILTLQDAFAVTSGSYERCFTGEDGKLYHHIIDPATGYPAESGLLSVTVVGDSGTRCDALSTALFVMGSQAASDFWRGHGDFEMILLQEDGLVLLTPGLEDCFDYASAGGQYRYEIIR